MIVAVGLYELKRRQTIDEEWISGLTRRGKWLTGFHGATAIGFINSSARDARSGKR